MCHFIAIMTAVLLRLSGCPMTAPIALCGLTMGIFSLIPFGRSNYRLIIENCVEQPLRLTPLGVSPLGLTNCRVFCTFGSGTFLLQLYALLCDDFRLPAHFNVNFPLQYVFLVIS